MGRDEAADEAEGGFRRCTALKCACCGLGLALRDGDTVPPGTKCCDCQDEPHACGPVARLHVFKVAEMDADARRCTAPLCRGWVGLDCDGEASHEESEDEHNARVEAEERGELGVRL